MKSYLLRFCLSAPIVFVAGSMAADEPIRVSSVQVTLIDDVSVPAREAGILDEVLVRVGSKVKAGDVLGRI